MKHPAIEMYEYHIWANAVIIERLKELPQEIYHQETNSGFSSIAKVLSHIYQVDYAWFEIIKGMSMKEAMSDAFQKGEQLEVKAIEDMEAGYLELSEQNKAFLNQLDDIEKKLVVDNPYAGILETSISESVLHIVTHGSYHRGNLATMLRQLGQTSVMQDYGLYLYAKQKK
ncbi:DinB family protein [Heyndrickxia oleronia]|jgi:uncharacterized damage-inducible protein DinB|uniref:DinB family protein n=1 Tax=Heyndrickxia oleronia TaxID=38875 RepID=UPI00242B1455|nr:DinB family protein [Heyndrickxia oleronia]MCI1592690.1 DinB family protein [Heyndrickxia oleronia]MCI1611980.1 DinB family protein [Heyndrickxia oleronia]MCI1743014.1 DinB family protein [Heyndrickxia oleronia]MCI1763810.1 DinB family protein [Heyndrickxia oleronia]